MHAILRWSVTPKKEKTRWDSVVHRDPYIFGIFFNDFAKPPKVRHCFLHSLRRENRRFSGYGKEITALRNSIEILRCYYVIDDSYGPYAVLWKIPRMSTPRGMLFLDVEPIVLLGPAHRYSATGYAPRAEILGMTQRYRRYLSEVSEKLPSSGIQFRTLESHTAASNLIGRARDCTFLGTE